MTAQLLDELFRAQESALRSTPVLDDALAQLPEQYRQEYNAKDLSSRLEIELVRSRFILKVGLTDRHPHRVSLIVNAVVTMYLKRLDKSPSFTVRVIEVAKAPKVQ